MKLSVFNAKAPALINQFSGILDQLLNGDVQNLNLDKLKASLNGAMESNKAVGQMLNSVDSKTLLKLRANAAAGEAYGSAVDHHASLNSILPVLMNLLNEIEPEDAGESIDDIMGAGEDCASKNAGPDGIGDDSPAAESGVQDGTPAAAAVPEGQDAPTSSNGIDDLMGGEDEDEEDEEDDVDGENCGKGGKGGKGGDLDEIDPESFNFAGTKPSVVAKKPSQANSASGVSLDFLA